MKPVTEVELREALSTLTGCYTSRREGGGIGVAMTPGPREPEFKAWLVVYAWLERGLK